MNNLERTEEISKLKEQVSKEEWKQRILECTESGMSIKNWCLKNEISISTYYFHLRKIRESLIDEQKVVPLIQTRHEPKVEHIVVKCGEISIEVSNTVTTEQLVSVIKALKSC